MMRTLELLRNKMYWGLDWLKGRPVGKHLDEIQFILENYTSTKAAKIREGHLEKLLRHAVETTPFYSDLEGYKSINDFPVLTKIDIRNSYEELKSITFKNKKNIPLSTSGTTGIPFTILQDVNKKHRNTADTFYFAKKAGYEIGMRLYYVRLWLEEYKRSKLGLLTTNIEQVNILEFSDIYFEQVIDTIKKDNSTKAMIGYASALSDLAKYLEKSDHQPIVSQFNSVIANAEALSGFTKKTLGKYLGKTVLSRYSNMENGILAQQILDGGNDFHINWASYIVEVLDIDSNQPVEDGEIGRIVITDLFNHCMPMIRYDTGDLGVLSMDNNNFNGAPVIRRIEGRKMDTIYSTQGQPVSPFFAYEMEHYPELKQFQLIQEGKKEYTIKLNLEGVFKHEEKLAKSLKEFLGSDANLTYEYVDEFPQLASGKRRLTVNNYNTPQ